MPVDGHDDDEFTRCFLLRDLLLDALHVERSYVTLTEPSCVLA